MELQAAGATIVAAGSRVSGRIADIQSGPAGGLSLELTALQVGAGMQAIVTGRQEAAAASIAAPAAQAPSSARIPAGTLLEFRLLQPFDVPLR
jgi:hypothetical protein